jgi:hypothetical protein
VDPLTQSVEPVPQPSRRRFLAGAAIAAGSIGLTGVTRPERAEATVVIPDGWNGYNDVTHPNFGATGDGSTDDTAAIQACIRASADSDPLKRRAVYFPPGIYRTSAVLLLPSYSILVGVGPLSIIKGLPAATTAPPLLKNDSSTPGQGSFTDIHIEGLTLDGNKSERNGSNPLIRLYGASHDRVVIRRVIGLDSPFTGFQFDNMTHSVVEGCHVRNSGKDGISFYSAGSGNSVEDVLIEGNIVEGGVDDHIVVGIGAGGQSTRSVTIVGNICDARSATQGAAIAVRGGERIVVSANVCKGGFRAGIEMSGTSVVSPPRSAPNRDIVVADNVISEPGKAAGQATAAQGGGAGILGRTGGVPLERVSLRGNDIFAPRYHGINVYTQVPANGAVGPLDVVGNTVLIDSTVPYFLSGASGISITNPLGTMGDIRLDGNDVRSANGPGMYVSGVGTKRCDVHDNIVLDSGTQAVSTPQAGIYLDGVSAFLVTGNRVQDTRSSGSKTQGPAVNLTNTSGNNLVVGNDLSENLSGAVQEVPPNAGTKVSSENLT